MRLFSATFSFEINDKKTVHIKTNILYIQTIIKLTNININNNVHRSWYKITNSAALVIELKNNQIQIHTTKICGEPRFRYQW